MSDSVFKFDDFIQKHKIDTNQLSEKTQAKIDSFDEAYGLYEEAEENSKEESDLLAKLYAYDSGLLSDLESFVAQQQKATPPAQAADGKQIEGAATPNLAANTTSTPSPEDAPSWRFWM